MSRPDPLMTMNRTYIEAGAAQDPGPWQAQAEDALTMRAQAHFGTGAYITRGPIHIWTWWRLHEHPDGDITETECAQADADAAILTTTIAFEATRG